MINQSFTSLYSIHRSSSSTQKTKSKQKRYGYDPTLYSAHPTSLLDTFLTSLLTSLDVDLLPGSNDPTGTILPQQGLHRALLPRGGLMGCREAEVKGKGKWKEKDGKEGKAEGGRKALRMLTNPCWSTVGGTRCVFLLTSRSSLPVVLPLSFSPLLSSSIHVSPSLDLLARCQVTNEHSSQFHFRSRPSSASLVIQVSHWTIS